MGKLLLSICIAFICGINHCVAQLPALLNFENKDEWQLNVAVPALGATIPAANFILPDSLAPIVDLLPASIKQALATEDNRWVINDAYTGGNVQPLVIKLQHPLDPTRDTTITGKFSDIPNTPLQPGTVSVPNKNYLHPISYYSSTVSNPPVFSAHYLHDLAFKRKHFAMMKNSISTRDVKDVKVSFWRVGGEGLSLYFSIDGGTSWKLLTAITGTEKSWVNQIVSHAELDNQAGIKLGILWDHALATEDATGIDEISITGVPIVATPTISAAVAAPSVCIGASFPVQITTTGNFMAGNIFTVQLSDANGNFANPVAIGTLPATVASTITATIPATTPAGVSYKVRVVSSNPAVTSPASTQAFAISGLPARPRITIQGKTALCLGEKVTLIAPQASSYVWSTGAVTQSIDVSQTGNYTVIVKNASGCTSEASLPVSVTVTATLAQPAITVTGKTTLCQGEKVVLTAPAAEGYLWSTGATSQSIEVSQSGNYTVKIKNNTGCESSSSPVVSITVHPFPAKPAITLSGSASFCRGGKVTLTAPDAVAYRWSTGAVSKSITVQENGEYWVSVKNAASCESVASEKITVRVHDLPAVPAIKASGSTSFCEGGKVVLTAPEAAQYRWSTGATTRTIEVAASGAYSVSVTNVAGCSSAPSAPVEVTVLALPEKPAITLSGSTTFCTGDSIVLTAPVGSGYQWSNGATSQRITVKQEGMYKVRVRNSAGCESVYSDEVTIHTLPVPATPEIDQINLDTLSASAAGLTYEWRKDQTILSATTRKIQVSENGNYTVRVKDGNGCYSAFSEAFDLAVVDKSLLNKITIYPNPSPGEFTILIENSASPVVAAQISSMLGQTLFTFHYRNSAKDFRRKIELPALPKGAYLLRLTIGETVVHKKFIIQ